MKLLILALGIASCGIGWGQEPGIIGDPPNCKSAMKRTSPTTWECPDPPYVVDTSNLAKKRRHIFASDADYLNKIHYHGAHRAVYVIGTDKCFTDDDTKKFPQSDLVCK